MKIRWRQTDVCQRLQHTLADHGPAALRGDQAAQRHLEECDECFQMLEALTALDAGFEAMPQVDAPDELVESLLERLPAPAAGAEEQAEAPTEVPGRSWAEAAGHGARAFFGPGQLRLKAAVAFALVVAIAPLVMFRTASQVPDARLAGFSARAVLPEAERGAGEQVGAGPALANTDDDRDGRSNLPAAGPVYEELRRLRTREELEALRDARARGLRQKLEAQGVLESEETVVVTPEPITVTRAYAFQDSVSADSPGVELKEHKRIVPATDVPTTATEGAKDDDAAKKEVFRKTDTYGGDGVQSAMEDFGDKELRMQFLDRRREEMGPPPGGLEGWEQAAWPTTGDDEATPADSKGQKRSSQAPAEPLEETVVVVSEIPVDMLHPPVADPAPAPEPVVDPERQAARWFLAERDDVQVTGPPATGYWTNTYVPGDPVLRYLQARLAGRDRSSLSVGGPEAPRLHDDARRTTQPFDPPPDAALALQLHSDRAAVEGETRMLVQVGLAGTPRRGGRRPAMNVALVLDLGGAIPAATGAGMIGLAGAFAEARDLGDRFRLIAAGPGGGELVTPDDFRHGPVTVATQDVVVAHDPAAGPPIDLVEALRLAIRRVAAGDDPSAPLGSSAIVLATSRRLGADVAALAELAHDSAVAGIPVSVVGTGDGVDVAELDRLALAGQGSRRLLRDGAEAPGLVDRELAAAGRAVARAVRLRIQLAPGVRLFDVVGSSRHDASGAERVRQAERAIDQRLARNLGLTADRGDDEAGIQIVIPTFYAGDHHAILLDVVVPGPGPVADVTVRFKDLVQLDNAVTRARLAVPRGEGGRGPLECTVLKNYLAHQLREVLEEAAGEVALGGPDNAAEYLASHRRLLAGLRIELAGFDRDPDVDRDLAMLDDYIRVLRGGDETPERHQYLADSLRYAGLLKVLPAPMPVGGG